MAVVRVGIEYDRTPREEWERQLWTIAPPNHHLTWLKLVWEPGDAWEPVERWMIYQMRSPQMMLRPHPRTGRVSEKAKDILRELQGPDPRSRGHYCATGWCACVMKANRWRGGLCKETDYAQWRLFQRTGHFGKRWWTIQGDAGGHRHRLDETESRVLRIMTRGAVTDTPAPGDLPYAEWDQRVFMKVAQLDRVRMWKGVTDYVHRNEATLDALERDEGQRAQAALWSWLESQVKGTVDKIGTTGAQKLKEAAPRLLDKPKPIDEEKVHEQFITQPF